MPNIEFRININDYKFNYHVIFSNEIDPEDIESEFLQALNIMDFNGEYVSLTRDNIERIGRDVKNQYEKSGDPYRIGSKSIYVSREQIKKILGNRSSIFKDKYMQIMVGNDWDKIPWDGRGGVLKKQLLKDCNALFSSNPSTINWMLGKKDVSVEKFKELFRNLKPCLHGSDTHSFENFCKPDGDKYCWIKADPTFEGLKQVMFEPDERIEIKNEIPEKRKSIYSLDSIEVKNSVINHSLALKEDKILFNKNLVVITGGKGSGKTALLDLIANCFDYRCKRSDKEIDENSFIQRIESKDPEIEIELQFIGEEVDNFQKKVLEKKLFEDSQITYLPQGKIDKYSSNLSLLDDKIQDIIFNNEKIAENGCRQRFEKLESEIQILSREIYSINNDIFQLEHDSSEKIAVDIGHKIHIKEGELKNKLNEIITFRETLADDTSSKIDELKEEEIQLRTKHSKLDDLSKRISLFRDDMEESIDIFNDKLTDFKTELTDIGLSDYIPSISFISMYNSIDEVLSQLNLEIDDLITLIFEKRDLLDKLDGDEKTQAKLIDELEIIRTEKEDLTSKIIELKAKKEKISVLEEKRFKKYLDLLNKYLEWDSYYKEVIEIFSQDKLEILGEVDFESKITLNKQKFIKIGNDLLHQGRIHRFLNDIGKTNLDKLANDLESIISVSGIDMDKLEEFIIDIFHLKGALKDSRSSNDFYNWVFGNYLSLNTNVLFENRSMETLSMGQKGTVLLKLFLSEGDYPLIIDQPEDNLDNRFIYKELVGAFKKSKKNRQIIIATNNANLVVNADAEQVIIAEFKENKEITYRSGSLENLETRHDIMHILEGGEQAFKEREEKYGII